MSRVKCVFQLPISKSKSCWPSWRGAGVFVAGDRVDDDVCDWACDASMHATARHIGTHALMEPEITVVPSPPRGGAFMMEHQRCYARIVGVGGCDRQRHSSPERHG